MDPLVSAADLKRYLQQPDLDDDLVAMLITNASGLVRGYCGWDIAPPASTTFVIDGTGTRMLSLPTLALTDIDEIRIDGTAIEAKEYRWQRRGQILRFRGWPAGMANVEVDATHGHDKAPDAVRAVVLTLAGSLVDNPTSRTVSMVGPVRSEYDHKLTELQYAQLNGFLL